MLTTEALVTNISEEKKAASDASWRLHVCIHKQSGTRRMGSCLIKGKH